MFIYIDESGVFVNPVDGGHSYACAGALTIPGRFHSQIIDSFDKLKCLWKRTGEEVKGRELNETQVANIVDMLLAGKARLHICVTNMAHNTPSVITARKHLQADRLMANITDRHTPEDVQRVHALQKKMAALPNQLFVQMLVMTEVVDMQLQDAVVHFALFDPPELGAFHWVVDQKDASRTVYEDLFHTLVAPFIQARQFSGSPCNRIACVTDGDYSHFARFCGRIPKWPDHLPPRKGKTPGKPIDTIDIGRILRDSFTLADSATCSGLQLVSCPGNTFT